MRGGSRSLTPVLVSLALAAALATTACGDGARSESARSGSLPIDTAAGMPLLPGDSGGGSDSAGVSDSASGLPDDSIAAAMYGTGPAPISVVPVADSAAGHSLFHGKGRCFTCHGERGQGTPRLGSTLADDSWLAGNGSLAWIAAVIENGVASPSAASVAMPAYSGMLSAREVELVASYVYTLSHANGTIPGNVVSDTLIDESARETPGENPSATRATRVPGRPAPPPALPIHDSRDALAATPIRPARATHRTGDR